MSSPLTQLPIPDELPRAAATSISKHIPAPLRDLAAALAEAGITTIEWGDGLSIFFGTPKIIVHHIWVVSDYSAASDIAIASGFSPTQVEDLNLGDLTSAPGWFSKSIPGGEKALCPDAIALLLPASTVPFDPKRLSFYAADNLSRPDAVGAFWAALRETCRATGELKPFWLSEFVVYTAMGIKYIKKWPPPTEEEDSADEATGLKYAAAMPWRGEAWLQETLEALIRGKMDHNQFTPQWWAERTGESLSPPP